MNIRARRIAHQLGVARERLRLRRALENLTLPARLRNLFGSWRNDVFPDGTPSSRRSLEESSPGRSSESTSSESDEDEQLQSEALRYLPDVPDEDDARMPPPTPASGAAGDELASGSGAGSASGSASEPVEQSGSVGLLTLPILRRRSLDPPEDDPDLGGEGEISGD